MKRCLAVVLLIAVCSGCQSVLHELKPHRLWRLNYTDAPGRSDGSFLSIDDPFDAESPGGGRSSDANPPEDSADGFSPQETS